MLHIRNLESEALLKRIHNLSEECFKKYKPMVYDIWMINEFIRIKISSLMLSRCNIKTNDAEYQMAHIFKNMKEKIENAKLLAANESAHISPSNNDGEIENIEVSALN